MLEARRVKIQQDICQIGIPPNHAAVSRVRLLDHIAAHTQRQDREERDPALTHGLRRHEGFARIEPRAIKLNHHLLFSRQYRLQMSHRNSLPITRRQQASAKPNRAPYVIIEFSSSDH
jgi:hypothetical protein